MKTIILLLTSLCLILPCNSFAAPKCKAKKNQIVKYDNRLKRCVYKKCKIKKGLELSTKGNKCTYTSLKPLAPISKWGTNTSIDPLDGTINYYAFVKTSDRVGATVLVLSCLQKGENKFLSIYLDFQKFFTFSDPGIGLNIDGKYYDMYVWYSSSDGERASWPDYKSAGSLADFLIDKNTIYGRASGLISSFDFLLDISNGRSAIEFVRSHCPGQTNPLPLSFQ